MKRTLALFSLVIGAALFLNGCGSSGPQAPQITPAMVSAGARVHADAPALERGRTAFMSRCAGCHALPAVASHSEAQWPGIVRTMGKRSGLSDAQSREVLAYILAAR